MSMPTLSLRIDSAIKPASFLRASLYSSLALVFTLLSWLASLSLWQYLLLFVVTALIISYLALSKPILMHISQPPLSKRLDFGWQLLMRTSRADELWQARLLTATRYPWLIHLRLVLTEPYRRPLVVTIFRDQVNAEQWRQLSILAKSIEESNQDAQSDAKIL